MSRSTADHEDPSASSWEDMGSTRPPTSAPAVARLALVDSRAARPLLLTAYTSQEVCIEANGSLAPMQKDDTDGYPGKSH